jgi:hypothetical protein
MKSHCMNGGNGFLNEWFLYWAIGPSQPPRRGGERVVLFNVVAFNYGGFVACNYFQVTHSFRNIHY